MIVSLYFDDEINNSFWDFQSVNKMRKRIKELNYCSKERKGFKARKRSDFSISEWV